MLNSRWATQQRNKGVYIIAEAGSSHRGDYHEALALVRAAAEAGADAIKFQTYRAEELAAPDVPLLNGYDAAHDAWVERLGVPATLQDLLGKGGLPWPWHAVLQASAKALGIDFLSTPFSVPAAEFLVTIIQVPALKIASGDLTYLPLLTYADTCSVPVLLSTGGATAMEVRTTLEDILLEAYTDERITLMHCRSIYPCPTDAVDLRVLQTWKHDFPLAQLGWSDHTTDSDVVPVAAVACGARVIEKHLRLTGGGQTPDTDHALNETQFAHMVRRIRATEAALGSTEKTVHPREKHDRLWARRSPTDWLRPTLAARAGQWEEA